MIDPQSLRAVRSHRDLLAFLGDQLDWPIGDLELEDATFEFVPGDLGIPAEQVPTIESIRQFRPLTVDQPWGIFFLEFSGARLPLTPLRRLLRALVTRARAGATDRRTWEQDDLLFFTSSGTGDSVELHLLAFFESQDQSQAEIRSLPWNPAHSPPQALARLAGELLPHLQWPEDTTNAAGWRTEWREAFKLRLGEPIANAKALAEKMARVATSLREAIEDAVEAEDEDGRFHRLLYEIRRELVGDVDADGFADLCAQTLVYGTLTSRVMDPEEFGASPTLTAVPLTTPFLASFFQQVGDDVATLDLDAAGLEQLVADLRSTNVEAILDQFGSTAEGGDPVIHFYEAFLAAYDPGIRAEVGAFYTPQPVVECIVRLVDAALKERIGLEGGVADQATWGEVAERTGTEIPTGVDPADPFVSVLDPATGTGTFLVEWIRRAKHNAPAEGWADYVESHLVPGLHGFELMLAPYAIAHLKLALELGPDADKLVAPVFLTDTLELPDPVEQLELLDPLAAEGQRAGEIKRTAHPTVIIGNPPYRRVRREETGGWVANADERRPALMQDFIDLANATVIFSAVASLYNLYVYFWRWSIWKALEESNGPAVIGFITAASWLDGPAFIGLREAARALCTEVWVVDLGGDNRGAAPEDNVFAIETPVSIVILIRGGSTDSNSPAETYYRRIRGTRSEKLAAVRSVEAPGEEDAWERLPSEPNRILRPAVTSAEWISMPRMADLFPWQQPGAKLNRTWPVAPDQATLRRRWEEFLADPEPARRSALFPDRRHGRRVETSVRGYARLVDVMPGAEPQAVAPYQWRPFDRQWTFADPRLAMTESPALWQSAGQSQVFFATLVTTPLGAGPALQAFAGVPDMAVFRGSYGGKDITPLYRDRDASTPNVAAGLLDALTGCLRLNSGDLSPEDLAAYCFALLSTPGYQQRFSAELESRELRVPVTSDASIFKQAVELGTHLVWLHTGSDRFRTGRATQPADSRINLGADITRLPLDGSQLTYDPERNVLFVADGMIEGVPPAVWNFTVSGWPVVLRWLEHRTGRGRGRRSSELDGIRPTDWADEWTDELLTLLRTLTATVELQLEQDQLLAEICDGPLIKAADLPQPTDDKRKAPPTVRGGPPNAMRLG